MSSNPQDLNVTLNTNLPCISYADNGYASGYGFSFECKGEAGAVDVQVFGKKRDGEILNLLEYINAGDKVEVPAVVSSKQDAMNHKFQPVRSASVLKIDEALLKYGFYGTGDSFYGESPVF